MIHQFLERHHLNIAITVCTMAILFFTFLAGHAILADAEQKARIKPDYVLAFNDCIQHGKLYHEGINIECGVTE